MLMRYGWQTDEPETGISKKNDENVYNTMIEELLNDCEIKKEIPEKFMLDVVADRKLFIVLVAIFVVVAFNLCKHLLEIYLFYGESITLPIN